jgi:hypothetical protein
MKPPRLILFLCFWASVPFLTLAQHPKQQVIWYGYFITLPISENWYNVTEIQNRQLILPFQQSQFLIRTRFHRSWSSKWDTSIGFSTFFHHRERPLINDDFNWPEGRPHLDITYKSKLGLLAIEHRIRGEARFYQRLSPKNELDEGFFFLGFRYRYRFQMSIPLAKAFQLKLANELMAMSAGTTGGLTFDQNRVYSDLVYAISPQLQLELGYIHLFQQTGKEQFLRQDILRINLRHQLKKRK